MKGSDILLSILIFAIFSGLVVFNIVAVEMNKVKKNWPEYRCNPMIMPLAAQLGPEGTNVGQNFTYCIQNMQSGIFKYLMQPFEILLSAIAQAILSIVESLAELSNFFSVFKNLVGGIFGNLYSLFFNLLLQLIKFITTIEDLVKRISATIQTLGYTIKTTGLLAGSVIEQSGNLMAQAEPTSADTQQTLSLINDRNANPTD